MTDTPRPYKKRPPRVMERGWVERHIQGQADGSLPPGTIQLRHADGTLAFDRLGRPRMWSIYVRDAMAPRGRSLSPAEAAKVHARLKMEVVGYPG